MMRLYEEGHSSILKELESLKKGWDGYEGKPIKKKVLDKFRDMSFMHELIL